MSLERTECRFHLSPLDRGPLEDAQPLLHIDRVVAQAEWELAAARTHGDVMAPLPDPALDQRGCDCDGDVAAGVDLLLGREEANVDDTLVDVGLGYESGCRNAQCGSDRL